MKRLALVALALLCACKRAPVVAAEDAAPSEVHVDAINSPPPLPSAKPSVDFTPDASTSPEDRKRALASLLAGASPARDLAEQATNPGRPYDDRLREQLTTVAASAGDAGAVRGDPTIGAAVATSPVSDADRVLAGLRPRFRNCYQSGLNSDPTMTGTLTLTANLKANGEVESADASSKTGLSPQVASCLAGVLRRAQFAAPGGGGSTLSVPVTFTSSK